MPSPAQLKQWRLNEAALGRCLEGKAWSTSNRLGRTRQSKNLHIETCEALLQVDPRLDFLKLLKLRRPGGSSRFFWSTVNFKNHGVFSRDMVAFQGQADGLRVLSRQGRGHGGMVKAKRRFRWHPSSQRENHGGFLVERVARATKQ